MGTGTETRAVAEMGTWTGSGRAEERRRNARNRTIFVDAIRHFDSARVILSADGGSAYGYPTAPFAKPGACTRASYRGGDRVRGAGRSKRGRGRERRWERGRGRKRGRGWSGNGNGGRGERRSARWDEDGSGDGAGTGVETRERTKDGNGDRSGDGNESSSGDENGDEDGHGNGNEDMIGEGGREAKKRKKPNKSCSRHVGNGGDWGGRRKKRRNERVGPVAANLDNLERE